MTLLLNVKGVKAYLEVWTKSAMATEDLLVDDGGHRQTVETVGEGLPQLDVVASLAWKKTQNIKNHFLGLDRSQVIHEFKVFNLFLIKD